MQTELAKGCFVLTRHLQHCHNKRSLSQTMSRIKTNDADHPNQSLIICLKQ